MPQPPHAARRRKLTALSRRVSGALPGVDGAISTRRSEEILCEARNCLGKIGVVRTALDDHLLLDEGLVLAVQIEPDPDRDWTVYAEDPFSHMRAHKSAHFTSGIRVQFKSPLPAIGRRPLAHGRLETLLGEAGCGHVLREIARQVGEMKPRERVGGFGHQSDRCRGGCRKRHDAAVRASPGASAARPNRSHWGNLLWSIMLHRRALELESSRPTQALINVGGTALHPPFRAHPRLTRPRAYSAKAHSAGAAAAAGRSSVRAERPRWPTAGKMAPTIAAKPN